MYQMKHTPDDLKSQQSTLRKTEIDNTIDEILKLCDEAIGNNNIVVNVMKYDVEIVRKAVEILRNKFGFNATSDYNTGDCREPMDYGHHHIYLT